MPNSTLWISWPGVQADLDGPGRVGQGIRTWMVASSVRSQDVCPGRAREPIKPAWDQEASVKSRCGKTMAEWWYKAKVWGLGPVQPGQWVGRGASGRVTCIRDMRSRTSELQNSGISHERQERTDPYQLIGHQNHLRDFLKIQCYDPVTEILIESDALSEEIIGFPSLWVHVLTRRWVQKAP